MTKFRLLMCQFRVKVDRSHCTTKMSTKKNIYCLVFWKEEKSFSVIEEQKELVNIGEGKETDLVVKGTSYKIILLARSGNCFFFTNNKHITYKLFSNFFKLISISFNLKKMKFFDYLKKKINRIIKNFEKYFK